MGSNRNLCSSAADLHLCLAHVFVIAWLKWEESLTLGLPVSSADNLGKQFDPRSAGSKLFDILMKFLKEFFSKS